MITSTENTAVTTDVQTATEVNPHLKEHLEKTREMQERQTAETQRLLKHRALLAKIKRHLHSGGHLVQMRNPDTGEYDVVRNVELSGDELLGYRDENDVPWKSLRGDHVMIGGDIFRLNPKPTTKVVDPCMKFIGLASALNSMMDYRTRSVFIACSFYNGEDFFQVERFLTDGTTLVAIAAHDGSCHDLVQGCCWVYDLKYRRYVYGEGGPLENDPR